MTDLKASKDSSGNILIQVVRKVEFSGKIVAYLIADINKDVVIHQLTYQEHEDSHSRLELVIDDIKMVVWDSINESEKLKQNGLNDEKDKSLSGKIYFDVPVENYHFVITSYSIHYTKLYDRESTGDGCGFKNTGNHQ